MWPPLQHHRYFVVPPLLAGDNNRGIHIRVVCWEPKTTPFGADLDFPLLCTCTGGFGSVLKRRKLSTHWSKQRIPCVERASLTPAQQNLVAKRVLCWNDVFTVPRSSMFHSWQPVKAEGTGHSYSYNLSTDSGRRHYVSYTWVTFSRFLDSDVLTWLYRTWIP